MSDYRDISDLGMDEITAEFLREKCIEMGTELEVDTRQGSLYRDAAEGHITRIAEQYDFMRSIAQIIKINTCTGEVLDAKLHERGLYRNPPFPTPAHYYCNFIGAVPVEGDLLTCSGYTFTVESVVEDGDDLTVIIVSTETGTAMNYLIPGTAVIPEIDVDGLISCTLGALYDPAEDAESDDSARARLIRRVAGPDENGNISQIRTWCEAVEGVGKARIIPLWDGPMTVKAVLIGLDGKGAVPSIVAATQEYIDPGCAGMGEGKAAIGQFVTVVAAENLAINVSVSIVKQAEVSFQTVTAKIEEALNAYLKSLAQEEYSSQIQVRYARVSATIMDLEEVIDLDNLLVNGGVENITFTIYEVPVLGEVTVNGDI